jgi:hypothetical protein
VTAAPAVPAARAAPRAPEPDRAQVVGTAATAATAPTDSTPDARVDRAGVNADMEAIPFVDKSSERDRLHNAPFSAPASGIRHARPQFPAWVGWPSAATHNQSVREHGIIARDIAVGVWADRL